MTELAEESHRPALHGGPPSWLLPVAWALLFLGLAAGLYRFHFPPGPVADEAAYVMITQSLWHDRDLTYDHRDLTRGYQTWDHGPHGLVLFTTDGGETMYFGKPLVFSLAALPFYLVFGLQGFVIFNMVLFLGMTAVGWLWLRRHVQHAGLYVVGFFFASAAFVYVFWAQPEVFNMACVFLPLAVWRWLRQRQTWRRREWALLALAGGSLAAAFVSKEPTLLLGLPLAVDLLWQRRVRGLLILAGSSLLVLAVLVGLQVKLTGQWSPYRGVQRRSFENEYPLETKNDLWALYKGTSFGSWSGLAVETNPRVLARNLGYFVVGRHTGLLPYFPFALFALGLYLRGPRGRAQHLLLLAVAGYVAFTLLVRADNYHGGAGFVGNRYFASVYPALLFLPSRRRDLNGTLLLPLAAAALWTLPAVAVPVQQVAPEFGLQVHTRSAAFRALPLELTLLPERKVPGYWVRSWGEGVWIVPQENFFARERHKNGVWVRGNSRSQVWVASPVEIDALRFLVHSPLPDNVLTLASSRGRLVVRFDTPGKRSGLPVELPVAATARDLDGFFPDSPHEHYYRFTVETTHGWVPMRQDPGSLDPRYLSVFFDFVGQGP